ALTPYSHHTPLFFLRNRPPPRPTLFPYTTLFRSHARLDRLVEGDPDVLIENGIVQIDRCRAELITLIELEAAAHKQGFSSLSEIDRKSTRLNSSHVAISYAVFCLKKKKRQKDDIA